ncbi:hypothetical protein M231_07966, partial [Tremella mesenterica]
MDGYVAHLTLSKDSVSDFFHFDDFKNLELGQSDEKQPLKSETLDALITKQIGRLTAQSTSNQVDVEQRRERTSRRLISDLEDVGQLPVIQEDYHDNVTQTTIQLLASPPNEPDLRMVMLRSTCHPAPGYRLVYSYVHVEASMKQDSHLPILWALPSFHEEPKMLRGNNESRELYRVRRIRT